MDRDTMLAGLGAANKPWDVIVVGGGATGLGVAVDASTRGYRTLLLERADFAQGTSSRSTKLIHGGVRYLQQGNVGLVLEALRERGLLTQNAPHLVSHLGFIVPNYTWWEAPFYGVGLKIYDLLAGKLGLAPSKHLSRKETLALLPTLEPKGLRGGTIYFDGQFDDARLAVALARTAADHGAFLLNYFNVLGLLKKQKLVRGVHALDEETGKTYELRARVVINATGVFTDHLRQLDDPSAKPLIAPSQGVHVVMDRAFLPGDHAIMVPKTDDGRVLFAIPWQNRTLVGTTDTAVAAPLPEPRPLPDEIDFLLTHAARYLTKDPQLNDIKSTFAGLRPLVSTKEGKATALVPRDHTLITAESGLITITGGKWTTYRKMAQDTVDAAAMVGSLPDKPCATETLRLHGWQDATEKMTPFGSDESSLQKLALAQPDLGRQFHPDLPLTAALVIWAVKHEMARTLEDVLSRRSRCLLLDARTAIQIAPAVAHVMAHELNRNIAWEKNQTQLFTSLAKTYLPNPS